MEANREKRETQLPTDADLVRSAKNGDSAAFEELVKRHTRQVFSVAQHITGSREDAEDVTQETFLRRAAISKTFRRERGSIPG